MKISEFLQRAKAMLRSVSESPQLDAEILLSCAIEKPRAFLFSRPEYLLSTRQKKQAGVFLQQRISGIPIAYILGKKEFYGRDFFVDTHVLIPRPETELLAEKAISLLSSGGTLIDVGTGSGCIAITVALNSSPDCIFALDISRKALGVAKKNAQCYCVPHITFLESDLLQNLPEKHDFSSPVVLTANLPYVPQNDRHISIRYEPEMALFSGGDGLDHYRRFFDELESFSFSHCLFEFHPPQKNTLVQLLKRHFPNCQPFFFCDYSGCERFGMISLE
jgi:release factor glutamine methyltransferase